jgi:hypothetical protein
MSQCTTAALQVTPTFPTSLGGDWNLIHRVVFPLQRVPFDEAIGDCMGMAPGEILSCPSLPDVLQDPFDGTTGFGDIVYAGLLAPSASIKVESTGAVFVWGVGGTSIFPTASEAVLGSGPNAAWRIGMSPNISIDWTATGGRLTVPIGLGAGRMVSVGPLPLNVHAEVNYSGRAAWGRSGEPFAATAASRARSP